GRALPFVARVRGTELSTRDWDWHDGSFIDEAVELLGEREVRNRLTNADDDSVRRFRDRWDQDAQRSNEHPRRTHKERMRSWSVSDILSEASKEKPSHVAFRGWGMHATDSELKAVLARLW